MSPNPNSFNGGNIDERYFLLGMVFAEKPFETEFIESALESLKSDSDVKTSDEEIRDKALLERGWFHASEDSKHAHSYFCVGLNAIKEPYEYKVIYWDKEYKGAEDLKTEADVHRHLIQQVLTEFASHEKFRLHVNIAHRSSFSTNHINKFKKEHIDSQLYSASKTPFITSSVINDIRVSVVDGSDPGIQLVDFILWAYKRKLINGNTIWYDRIIDDSRIKFSNPPSENFPFGADELTKNGGIKWITPPTTEVLYGSITGEEWNPDDVQNSLFWVELKLIKLKELLVSNEDLEYLSELYQPFYEASETKWENDDDWAKSTKKISEIVLLLMNTLFEPKSSMEKKFHQISRKFSAIINDKSDLRWLGCLTYWTDLRRNNLFKEEDSNLIEEKYSELI